MSYPQRNTLNTDSNLTNTVSEARPRHVQYGSRKKATFSSLPPDPGKWIMALTIPAATQAIIDEFEASTFPTVDYEIADKFGGVMRVEGLSPAERKGAWAESTPFHLRPSEDSPWGTYYAPSAVLTKPDGTPSYVPDIADVDHEVLAHWESRAENAQNPVLRARYADAVWDLKKKTIDTSPAIAFAHRAIDAYLDGVAAGSYKEPVTHAIQAARRALELALSVGDADRAKRSREALVGLFDQSLKPLHIGAWSMAYDALTESKKTGLTEEETARLVAGLERMLSECSTPGEPFDPFGAEAAARRLASHHERHGKKDDAQRVIRTYGSAFERISGDANSMLAMAWLQPVHDEFKNRGMNEDAERVMATLAERGKTVAGELKQIRVPVELKEEEIGKLVENLTQGSSPRDALLRIAHALVRKTGSIRAMLQEMLTTAPLMASIGVTRIVDGRFAARAGSIEDDPEGRLIMQLAQQIDFYNFLLNRTLDHLRKKADITNDLILSVLYESPVFVEERRPLIEEGIAAYRAGDHAKAIHIILPQIEQALRELLCLMGVPTLKAGRNGTVQVKNLNDILREPAIKQALGDDVRLYLQTFLADERGQNIRNLVCHGLAASALFNYRLADQALHALLTVSLVRANPAEPPPTPVAAGMKTPPDAIMRTAFLDWRPSSYHQGMHQFIALARYMQSLQDFTFTPKSRYRKTVHGPCRRPHAHGRVRSSRLHSLLRGIRNSERNF